MPNLTVFSKVKKEIWVAPCIKCGGEDIIFSNPGYSSFNIGSVTCKKCRNSVRTRYLDWDAKDSDMVPYWNEENDPDVLHKKYEAEISKFKLLIKQLPKKKK